MAAMHVNHINISHIYHYTKTLILYGKDHCTEEEKLFLISKVDAYMYSLW